MTEKPSKSTFLNQLYFILAGLLGLICLVMGGVSLINTLLISTILQVNEPKFQQPPMPYLDQAMEKRLTASPSATEDQTLTQWRADYQRWQTEQSSYDYQSAQRKRELAWAISLILVGIPVFALHAPVVFKRAKSE